MLQLCLDLNIWVSALIADQKGKQNTACQYLVKIVDDGNCSLGLVQLVISWGMLSRLLIVLEGNLNLSHTASISYVNSIIDFAYLGALRKSPQLTLGGVGVIALKDDEDVHVLETALAGKATVLVTQNFKDFISNDTTIIIPERHAIYQAAKHTFDIVHPFLMVDWLRQGFIPKRISN